MRWDAEEFGLTSECSNLETGPPPVMSSAEATGPKVEETKPVETPEV